MTSQEAAFNILLNTKDNIFLTGKAGTGKSYLILGNKVFAKGQLYVALSRARSLEGVNLSRKITANDVQRNEIIDSFLS